MQANVIERFTQALPCSEVLRDVPLSRLTSFCIGGPAAMVIRPASDAELETALSLIREYGVAMRVLGNGTNVLCPDEGFDGVILRFDRPLYAPRFEGVSVWASACQSLCSLSKAAAARGLMGLESLCGIPGTVGGAVAMNAGAYGTETADALSRVRILRQGSIVEESVDRSAFGFRVSPYTAPGCIVLDACFMLSPDDGTAQARMAECARKRAEKQPLSDPSAGSVFKRPAGHYAGSLIEEAGLKGLRVGDAMVSPLHAGFIVNAGSATQKDVLCLIETVQRRVFQMSGVHLERELKLLGEL